VLATLVVGVTLVVSLVASALVALGGGGCWCWCWHGSISGRHWQALPLVALFVLGTLLHLFVAVMFGGSVGHGGCGQRNEVALFHLVVVGITTSSGATFSFWCAHMTKWSVHTHSIYKHSVSELFFPWVPPNVTSFLIMLM
jgi:hypothetical protein